MSKNAHHTPNVLPPGHAREDYDFDYKDGVSGPIRLAAVFSYGVQITDATVWCKQHGWEPELFE